MIFKDKYSCDEDLCYRRNCWPSMKRIVWYWIRWLPLSMMSLSLLQAELLTQHEENCLVLNQMTASVNDLIVFITGRTAGLAWRELFGSESDDCLCLWSHCLCYRRNCWPSMKRTVWFWIRWLPLLMISLSLLQAELLAQHEENCLVLNQMTASVYDLIVFVTGGTAGPAWRELFGSESDDCLC